jgi:hypothetical protein
LVLADCKLSDSKEPPSVSRIYKNWKHMMDILIEWAMNDKKIADNLISKFVLDPTRTNILLMIFSFTRTTLLIIRLIEKYPRFEITDCLFSQWETYGMAWKLLRIGRVTVA